MKAGETFGRWTVAVGMLGQLGIGNGANEERPWAPDDAPDVFQRTIILFCRSAMMHRRMPG